MSAEARRRELFHEPAQFSKSNLTACPTITTLVLFAIALLVTGGILFNLNITNALTSGSIMGVGGLLFCAALVLVIIRVVKCGSNRNSNPPLDVTHKTGRTRKISTAKPKTTSRRVAPPTEPKAKTKKVAFSAEPKTDNGVVAAPSSSARSIYTQLDGRLIEEEEFIVVHEPARCQYTFPQKFGSLDSNAPSILKIYEYRKLESASDQYSMGRMIPVITQYGLTKGRCYPFCAIRLPSSYIVNCPFWIQNQAIANAELYFLLYIDRFAFEREGDLKDLRNLRPDYMVCPDWNPDGGEEEKSVDVQVALCGADGIVATEDIPNEKWNTQSIRVHKLSSGYGYAFSPDTMNFQLRNQELCEAFFTLKWEGKAAIFHTIILRKAQHPSDQIDMVEKIIEQASTVQNFIHNLSSSCCLHKDVLLKTFKNPTNAL